MGDTDMLESTTLLNTVDELMKRTLLAAVALSSMLWAAQATSAADDLGIGSPAPPIDVEHWIQDGNGFFKPVTDFEPGHVYVVEFWATWCGPCITSMPHLAELQNQYRGEKVQIISISDEKLQTVKDFLKQQAPGGDAKTFAEITSAYSLTTDPDRSAHEDYMEASEQNGIPTSFIVGKDSKIEWIGHPMRLDEPLEQVVGGKWDREKFKEEYQEQKRFEQVMQRIAMLAGTQKFDEAIALVQTEVDAAKTPESKEQMQMLLYNLKLSAGKVDEDVRTYFRAQLEDMKGDPVAVGRFGYSIYSALQNDVAVGELAGDAIEAIKAEVGGAPAEYQPFLYNQLAQLYEATDKLAEAIAAQEKAVEVSEGRAHKRMQLYLEELKEKSGEEPAEESDSEEPAAAKTE